MAKFSLTLMVALMVSLGSSKDLGGRALGLGLGGGLDLHLPPLHLGISVELLIDVQTVLEILAKPYDHNSGINDCGTKHPPSRAFRNGLSAGNNRWYQNADGTWFVAIVMDPSFTQDEINIIYAGMIDIQNKTCMKFSIYQESDLAGFDYVYIRRGGSGSGCFSDYIGRAHVGKQYVNLQYNDGGPYCIWSGIASHELLHAIGFDHEKNTPGRNSYVSIQFQNIISGQEHNFNEDDANSFTSFGAPYDYGSIMHYAKDAFTSNGQDTIVVYSGDAIGQRDGLSSWDAYKVKKMHGCPT